MRAGWATVRALPDWKVGMETIRTNVRSLESAQFGRRTVLTWVVASAAFGGYLLVNGIVTARPFQMGPELRPILRVVEAVTFLGWLIAQVGLVVLALRALIAGIRRNEGVRGAAMAGVVVATLVAANTYHDWQDGRGSSDDSFLDLATWRGVGHILLGLALPVAFSVVMGGRRREAGLRWPWIRPTRSDGPG